MLQRTKDFKSHQILKFHLCNITEIKESEMLYILNINLSCSPNFMEDISKISNQWVSIKIKGPKALEATNSRQNWCSDGLKLRNKNDDFVKIMYGILNLHQQQFHHFTWMESVLTTIFFHLHELSQFKHTFLLVVF